MPILRIQLKSEGDPSYSGYRIRARFPQEVADGPGKGLMLSREISAAVEDRGSAALDFPDGVPEGSAITVTVVAPDGQVLQEESFEARVLGGEVGIEVRTKEYFEVQPTDDPAFGKPTRLRGLVIDSSGKSHVGGRQVVIQGKYVDDAEGAAPRVVGVAQTDARGYFSIPYPLNRFSVARGQVETADPVPISVGEDGYLPERVVLGGELPDSGEGEDHDCSCKSLVPRDPDEVQLVESPETFTSDVGASRCVSFDKPNRVLEEFDYHTVVRTTEPEIKGLTLESPPKVGLRDVLGILDPKIFGLLLETQPKAALLSETVESRSAAAAPRLAAMNRPADPMESHELLSSAVMANKPELEHLSEAISLASLRLASREREDGDRRDDIPRINANAVQLDAEVVKTLVKDPDGFSLTRLAQAEMVTRKNDLLQLLDLVGRKHDRRGPLSCENAVDWDDTPTFYQTCTIAHGHILHFKQQWVADGYSLGDLLYSLPLAPCQKKQIAVVDWDRREAAARTESLEEREQLSAMLNRDRDISEIASASVRENLTGGSSASTDSFGFGGALGFIGEGIGGLLGFGGGSSSAGSTAWQNSGRDTSASSLQQLRDRTVQGATSVRNQRSTVIQTVHQGETMRVETEVVANHNHCHAITIQYFEVLRHFLVRHRLVDVQECLLVPLLMSRFDSAKARRWRGVLQRYLRDRTLRRGFDALQRIADNYVGSDMPLGAYAEEDLTDLNGYLRISFRIQRPRDNDDGSFLNANWGALSWLGITPQQWWTVYLKDQQDRDRIFAEILGPRIAEEISNGLQILAVDASGNETPLPVDTTLVSDFQNDQPLYVSISLAAPLPPVRRDRINFIKISPVVNTKAGQKNIDDILPAGSKIIVQSGQVGYRTPHIAHDLFQRSRILNDLSGTDGVLIATPLSHEELRRPRDEDKDFANRLLSHLNDGLEYYHRAIWWSMDAQRRFMLLDGFIAPNSGGRSVASVVENRLIGIIGNCLVMPVAPGFHLDPTYKVDPEKPVDLLEHYQPTTPVAPLRVAVPTKGVFAESVMGSCNSCEKEDDSRFWRWEESPCPDEPTPIQPVSTESRRSDPPNLTPQPFPQPIVAFQNAPPAPDPQGFAGLLQLLSNPNLFRDITGLTENQKNALAGLQAALGTAQFFGGKAADLALQGSMKHDIDKTLDKIDQQHRAGAINDEQRSNLTEAALRSMMGGGTQSAAKPMTTEEVQKLTKTAGAQDAAVSVNRPGGESVSVDARPLLAQAREPLKQVCGFFPSEGVVSERDLRDAIRTTAEGEHALWFDGAGNALSESDDDQFGLLVKYCLAEKSAIFPTTLTALQGAATGGTIAFGDLLDAGASTARVDAEAARVATALLAGIAAPSGPANLNNLIESALKNARASRLNAFAWSAVFVSHCVRAAAIQLGLEFESGTSQVGRDELLLASIAHRLYTVEAYRRRFGPGKKDGTYHAFSVSEQAPQIADILVQDRQAGNIAGVIPFNDIPTVLPGGRELHGDIVVEVNANDVVTIGGNLSNGVRRRRYPLSADGKLLVRRDQMFTQEGNVLGPPANVPVVNAAAGLNSLSTGRLFAALSLVELCAAVPGQQVEGGVLV